MRLWSGTGSAVRRGNDLPPLGAARNGRKEQACPSALLRMADTPVAAAIAPPTRVAYRGVFQSIEPGMPLPIRTLACVSGTPTARTTEIRSAPG